MQFTKDAIIESLELEPHIEGGFFKENFKAEESIPGSITGKGARAFISTCYYLLSPGERSIFHRVSSDEIWSYHLGGPLRLFEIFENATFTETILGPDLHKGHKLNHRVKKNTWVGALPSSESEFCLVNAIVYPGFEFEDWERGDRNYLMSLCPQAASIIELLT